LDKRTEEVRRVEADEAGEADEAVVLDRSSMPVRSCWLWLPAPNWSCSSPATRPTPSWPGSK